MNSIYRFFIKFFRYFICSFKIFYFRKDTLRLVSVLFFIFTNLIMITLDITIDSSFNAIKMSKICMGIAISHYSDERLKQVTLFT